MKESKAWRILAEEYDARRTDSEFLCLCLKYDKSRVLRRIPEHTCRNMVTRIQISLDSVDYTAYGVFESEAPDVRPARVLACLMFEQIAIDEEVSL